MAERNTGFASFGMADFSSRPPTVMKPSCKLGSSLYNWLFLLIIRLQRRAFTSSGNHWSWLCWMICLSATINCSKVSVFFCIADLHFSMCCCRNTLCLAGPISDWLKHWNSFLLPFRWCVSMFPGLGFSLTCSIYSWLLPYQQGSDTRQWNFLLPFALTVFTCTLSLPDTQPSITCAIGDDSGTILSQKV